MWTDTQIRAFAREVRGHVGGGWEWLTPEVRSAIVDAKVLAVIRGQDRSTIAVEAIDELHERLHQALGTTGD